MSDEKKQDLIQEALIPPQSPPDENPPAEELTDLSQAVQSEETVFGAPAAGGIPMSGPAMMQNMQERLGDLPTEAGETGESEMPTCPQIVEKMPASITKPRPVNTVCIQESLEIQPSPTSKGIDAVKLVEFVKSEQFTPAWCMQRINVLLSGSPLIPLHTSWKTPPSTDLPRLVFDTIRGDGYVASKWESVALVLGQSVDNVEWAAGILCWLALADDIQLMGTVNAAMRQMQG